jgi:branched-chain amino acid transport system ATP-binding protein
MLEVQHLDVSYGRAPVLHDVSLTVERGEIVVLLGPNGAGKTTTLRAISGMLAPRAGTIEFEGQRLNGLPPNRVAELGLLHVPEGRQLFGDLSVVDNLLMGAFAPRARTQRDESLEQCFTLFPVLRGRRRQTAASLSGGEQQMLVVGRALMARPRMLLLDEPSLGLAPQLVATIFDVIRKVNAEGVSVLLVEQNVRHSLRVAHRAYVLEGGRIVRQGTAAQLAADPVVQRSYLGL